MTFCTASVYFWNHLFACLSLLPWNFEYIVLYHHSPWGCFSVRFYIKSVSFLCLVFWTHFSGLASHCTHTHTHTDLDRIKRMAADRDNTSPVSAFLGAKPVKNKWRGPQESSENRFYPALVLPVVFELFFFSHLLTNILKLVELEQNEDLLCFFFLPFFTGTKEFKLFHYNSYTWRPTWRWRLFSSVQSFCFSHLVKLWTNQGHKTFHVSSDLLSPLMIFLPVLFGFPPLSLSLLCHHFCTFDREERFCLMLFFFSLFSIYKETEHVRWSLTET